MRKLWRVMVIIACAVLALAPTVTKLPDANGTYAELSELGVSGYTAVTTNDGDTTAIYQKGDAGALQTTFHVADLPSDAKFVDSVVQHTLLRCDNCAPGLVDWWPAAYYSGTTITGSGSSCGNSPGEYTDSSQTWPNSPVGAWTPASFNATEFGLKADGFGDEYSCEGYGIMATQIWVVVTYRSPAGVFVIRLDPE